MLVLNIVVLNLVDTKFGGEAMKTIDALVEELKHVLDYDEIEYPKDNDTILTMEIKSAIGAINRCRRFKPYGDKLYDERYEDKIIPLAETAFMKKGAEGEIGHTENGIVRQYSSGDKYPKEMLKDITPLAKWW